MQARVFACVRVYIGVCVCVRMHIQGPRVKEIIAVHQGDLPAQIKWLFFGAHGHEINRIIAVHHFFRWGTAD